MIPKQHATTVSGSPLVYWLRERRYKCPATRDLGWGLKVHILEIQARKGVSLNVSIFSVTYFLHASSRKKSKRFRWIVAFSIISEWSIVNNKYFLIGCIFLMIFYWLSKNGYPLRRSSSFAFERPFAITNLAFKIKTKNATWPLGDLRSTFKTPQNTMLE